MQKLFNIFSIISRDASVDMVDNMLSIHKVIENFGFKLEKSEYQKFTEETVKKGNAATFPANFFLTSSWGFEEMPKKATICVLQVDVIDPSGKKIGELKNEGQVYPGNDKVNFAGKIDNLPVTGNGLYKMHLELKDQNEKNVLADTYVRYNVLVEQNDKN
jgi:hypothetical protein